MKTPLQSKLAILPDPVLRGQHPLHENRYLVTEGAHWEEGLHPDDWLMEDGSAVATMRDCANQPEVAARLVACWNACESLDNPEGQIPALKKLATECVALRSSNKRLTEQLKRAVSALDAERIHCTPDKATPQVFAWWDDIITQSRAALTDV